MPAQIELKELREKRGALAKQMHGLLQVAAAEARALTAEERTNFDTLEAAESEIAQTLERSKKLLDLSEMDALHRDQMDKLEHRDRKHDGPTREQRGNALKAWALGKHARPEHRDAAKRFGLDPYYDRLMIGENDNGYEQRGSTLATHMGSTATGLDSVTIEPLQALRETMKAYGGVRQVATVITSRTGATMAFPVVDDTSTVATVVGESTARDTHGATFGSKTLPTHMYSSYFVKASLEYVQDSGIEFGSWLGSALGKRLARGTNAHYTVGSGSGQPFGVATDALLGTQPSSGIANISTTNLIALQHAVDPAWRVNGTWMMHDHTLKQVKSLVDTQGRPLWLPGIAVGEPDTLLGHPYIVNNDCATETSATSDIKIILFGDFSTYYVRDVPGFELQRLDERFADVGQVAWLAHARTGGRTIASSGTTSLWPILTLLTQKRT